MTREPGKPVDGELYGFCDFIMESSRELQEYERWLPDTETIPTTHEPYVQTRTEMRFGQNLTIKRVGVRLKQAHAETDDLNAMTDEQLEVEAAKAGIRTYDKTLDRSKRVFGIRMARKRAAKKAEQAEQEKEPVTA